MLSHTKFGILIFKGEAKKIVWLGNSKERLRVFPEITKDIAGRELLRVQAGETPTDWRPMLNVGPGVIEIRIHRPDEYRVLYIAHYPEAIYVLHAFQKTTKVTSEIDKRIGRLQYAETQKLRKENQSK